MLSNRNIFGDAIRKSNFRNWGGVFLIALGMVGIFSSGMICFGETCTLRFMPSVPNADDANGRWYPPAKSLRGGAQCFECGLGLDPSCIEDAQKQEQAAFAKAVTKEPSYVTQTPAKGLIRLGDQSFAFALDTAAEDEPEASSQKEKADKKDQKTNKKKLIPFFHRLYLDRNENGDLTDDKPIETSTSPKKSSRLTSSWFEFTLPIRQGDKTFEIPCRFNLRAVRALTTRTPPGQKSGLTHFVHAYAYFYAGYFREGKITLDDKTFRVFLIDGNSNGRFNDPMTLQKYPADYDVETDKYIYGNRFSPQDVFYLVPEEAEPFRLARARPGRGDELDPYYVGGMVGVLEGKFWNAEITPSGDRLTLTPRTEEVGFLQNSGHPFRLQAACKGPLSLLTLQGDENGKTPLPPGEWFLLNYGMEFEREKTNSSAKNDVKKDASEKGKKISRAVVVADFARYDDLSVTIKKNETKILKFGPPYHLVFRIAVRFEEKKKKPPSVRLSLTSLEGEAGESCDEVQIDGKRPPKPTFTIKTKDGKTAHEDAFEYG